VADVFDGVIGHRKVCELLRRESAHPVHAYLFVGAAGVGKATVARSFATLLLCPTGGDHDVACSSCRRASTGSHPDLVRVEPEGRTSLGVDQARAMVSSAALVPVESTRRVFLVEEAGLMTEQAANALLKTLEDPLGTVTFLLVAESEDDFPPTVSSRCRTVHFGRVPEDELTAALVSLGRTEEQARATALVAGGRPGLALSLSTRPEVAGFRRAWLELPSRVTGRPGDGYRLAEEMMAAMEPLLPDAEAEDPPEQRERARKRAAQALIAGGLEILASFYVDAASLQLGGPVRNRDLPYGRFTEVSPRHATLRAARILDAVVDLQANLRPQLLVASLLAYLGEEE
jgi:DNA polymerase-3 subunit delta'